MRTADEDEAGRVTPVNSLVEFFRDGLASALEHQRISLAEQTSYYVVSLLALYSRTEVSHGNMRPGQRWISLSELLSQASAAPSSAERDALLQRLGDVSLFIAGCFAQGFERRLVDLDYHIAMGGRAYGTLAAAPICGARRTLRGVFSELAQKFQPVVDAIGEISDSARIWGPHDVLRLYELWLKTGSRRAHNLLRQLGVVPVQAPLQAS